MKTKKDLQIELLQLEKEIELLTLNEKDKVKQLGKRIKEAKQEIELLDLKEIPKKKKNIELLSLEKTRKIPKKELEILTLEKTKKLNLKKLENTKKFTKKEMQYIALEMTQKVEQKKLQQELNIDIPKLDQKINALIEKKEIKESPILSSHTLEEKEKTSKEKKWKSKIIYIILLISSIIVLFFIMKTLLDHRTHDNEIKSQITDLINNTEITLDNTDGKKKTEESDYFKYMHMPLISVDFKELKKKNPDTKGWIQVAGTNVNYPYVQAGDNDYYLSHSFDKSYNTMGWVFLDYRNQDSFADQNSILYAHGLYNNTMFGSLKQVVEPNWYTNSENHIIKISTEKQNSLWEIFSTYTIQPESFYLSTNFEDAKSYEAFLITLQGRSVYKYPTNVSSNDHILTLSSCYNDDLRVVVHAKLIKTTERT